MKLILLALVFLLPLSSPSETVLRKNLIVPSSILMIFSLIVLCLFLYKIYGRKYLIIKKSPAAGLVLAFFIYEAARDIFVGFPLGYFGDGKAAFFGAFSSISFLILFAVLFLESSPKFNRQLSTTIVLSLTFVSLLALLQRFGLLPFFLPSYRTYATLANPTEMAGVVLIALILSLRSARSNLFYILATFALLAAILFSGSKAGIFLAIIVILLEFYRYVRRPARIHLLALFLAVVLAAALYLVPVPKTVVDSSHFSAKKFSEFSLLAGISSFRNRAPLLYNSFLAWSDRPLYGMSQSDFANQLQAYIQGNPNKIIPVSFSAFDSHNIFLNNLAMGGLTKIAIFLAVILFLAQKRTAFRGSDFFLPLVIYFAFALVSISYITGKLFFILLLALTLSSSAQGTRLQFGKLQGYMFPAFTCLFAFLSLFSFFVGYKRIASERWSTLGELAVLNKNIDDGIRFNEKAIELWPLEPQNFVLLADKYRLKAAVSLHPDEVETSLKRAKYYIEKALELSPTDTFAKELL